MDGASTQETSQLVRAAIHRNVDRAPQAPEGLHGWHSVFSRFRDFQVMYHVSHLLRSSGTDGQVRPSICGFYSVTISLTPVAPPQLERKRFICNNINMIVYCEPNVRRPSIRSICPDLSHAGCVPRQHLHFELLPKHRCRSVRGT